MVRLIYDGSPGPYVKSATSLARSADLELCLEFADTIDWRKSDDPEDKLTSYGDLLIWSKEKRLLADDEARRLAEHVKGKENFEKDVMKQARQLREAISRLFSAAAKGRSPDPKDLEVLNGHLSKSLVNSKLRASGTRYSWQWRDDESSDMMLWPIARSAADLLTSSELSKVKECRNDEDGCGWLFLDETKNQSRRWCSMDSCGNRMKFRKYYDTHSRSKKSR